jgi:four helix bundle protein
MIILFSKSLLNRTVTFTETVNNFCTSITSDLASTPLVTQLVSSSTGISTNYQELNNLKSGEDFINKISICKSDAKATINWIEKLSIYFDDKESKEKLQILLKEAKDLYQVFSKVINKLSGSV